MVALFIPITSFVVVWSSSSCPMCSVGSVRLSVLSFEELNIVMEGVGLSKI